MVDYTRISASKAGPVPHDGDSRACYPYDIKKTQEKIISAGLPEMLAERIAEGR